MSNVFVQTTFAITVARSEARIIQDALEAISIMEDEQRSSLEQEWLALSSYFRMAFANPDESPNFDTFLSIFDDPCWPHFGARFAFDDNADGTVTVTGDGDEFACEPVAELFRRAVTQSLPIAVTWAETCSKSVPGAFGGGAFRIDADGISWFHTHDILPINAAA